MLACLIRIDSNDEAGSALPLLVASHDDSAVCHLNSEQWEPALTRLPVLRYDFFGGDFSGNITAPRSTFQIATDGISDFHDRVFAGARVRVWTGELGDAFGSYTLRFDGFCATEPSVRDMVASFSVSVDDSALDEPLLDIYAGTGNAEGPDDLTGVAKPLLLGNVEYAFGRLINATDLVYQVNDGAFEAANFVYDSGKPLGSSTGDYASYAALVAASIPAGGWGSCKAEGLVRFGAPADAPAFSVSGDNGGSGGYVRKPGAIIARLAEIVGATTDATNISDFDTACPYNLQVDLFQQTTARQVIQSIADSVGGVAGVDWEGTLFVQALAIDPSPTVTLAADGTSALPVAGVYALPLSQPFWRLATEAEPTYVVLAPSEVATGYNFRGAYSSAREYRLDDLVYATDGRAFVYINATPSSGNAPPAQPSTSNSYWSLEGAATAGATDDQAEDIAEANTVIEPEFPVIEINQGDPGHTGSRDVTHSATRGGSTITGGTWALPSSNLTGATLSINSSTGTVTVSGVTESGSYTIRYTHTDGVIRTQQVNVTYLATGSGVVSAKNGRVTSSNGAFGSGWQTIATLTISSSPAGRISFGGIGSVTGSLSFMEVTTATGTASYEARMQIGGTTVTTVSTQSVVTGGVLDFSDFSALFLGSHAVSSGTVTVTVQVQRTSGTGEITATNTVVEGTVIAS